MEFNTYLEEYLHEIKCGNIIAGRELITIYEKLAEDLHNPKYYYDRIEGLLRIEWLESGCLQKKHPYHGKPFKLMLWEKAYIEVVFSFKLTATRKRRFREVLLLVGRKNGKTPIHAGLGFYEMRLGESGQEIIVCSNDDRQARLIFDTIKSFRKMIDPHNLFSGDNLSKIYDKKTDSYVIKISIKSQSKDGEVASIILYDEIHDSKNWDLYMPMQLSLSTAEEPLMLISTTEGYNQDEDAPLNTLTKKARMIINGELELEDFLPIMYTQDSEIEIYKDINMAYKSNPSLGVVKKWDTLIKNFNDAKIFRSKRPEVLTKDFNIRVSSVEHWLDESDYKYEAVFDINDFKNKGYWCLGAVDLAETGDLCVAKALLMKKGDKTKYIYTRYFLPSRKISERDDEESGAKYKEWVKMGLIEVTEGNENDHTKVGDWFYHTLWKEYGIRTLSCGYDPWHSKIFEKQLDEYRIRKEKVYQGKKYLSNAMRYVEADLHDKLINYNQNPIDQWCFGNTAVEADDFGLVQPIKIANNQSKKIDGAVCTIILYEMYRRCKDEFEKKLF